MSHAKFPHKGNKKDVFHAFMVQYATYDGAEEIPCITTSKMLPERVVPFSKSLKVNDYDQWVVFYENDEKITLIWNAPQKYINVLKRFKGVITPDFSLYRKMPIVMQKWSTYQGKAIGAWLQNEGIEVIPNVRFADERSYSFCFSGVEKNSTVAVGTHGCIKRRIDRAYFEQGFAEMVKQLTPQTVIVYGAAPDDIFGKYQKAGIRIIQFDSDYAIQHRKVGA